MGTLSKILWDTVSNGVWAVRLNGSAPRLMDFAAPPLLDRLEQLPHTEMPLPLQKATIFTHGGRTVVRIPVGATEAIYGLGLSFSTVNRRGKVMHLRCDHYFMIDNGRTHAPSPVFFTSGGAGLFVDTCNPVSVYCATTVSRNAVYKPPVIDRNTQPESWDPIPDSRVIEMVFDGDAADVYGFAGPNLLMAVRRFNLYCGGGCLPPKWGLGVWHRTPSTATGEEIKAEVEEFLQRGYPIDVLGLEPGWQSCSYPSSLEWAPDRFPDPAAFCGWMRQRGIAVNLWEQSFIAPEAPIANEMEPYAASYYAWNGLVPDYTMEAARKQLKAHHQKQHLSVGVSSYKLDECDGFDFYLWPDHSEFPSGLNGLQMRQLYALTLQKTITELFQESNRRTYGLIRASNAGASAYPFVLYNDCYDFKEYLCGLINCGFIGLLWSPEVRVAATPREFVRRFQLSCFSPMLMLNAWYSGFKPWTFEETADIVRDIFRLRKRLLPYIYSAFARYHFDGIPPVRALEMEYDLTPYIDPAVAAIVNENDPYPKAVQEGIRDQYMFGDCLMIAPMFPDSDTRTVVFPEGDWYDFYTGEQIEGGCRKTINAPLEVIPIFVKDGGVVPMLSQPDGKDRKLEIRYYGRQDGIFLLYDDDGETLDYQRGQYDMLELFVTWQNGAPKLSETVIHGKNTWDEKRLRYMCAEKRVAATMSCKGIYAPERR